jgi:hypothetical protein
MNKLILIAMMIVTTACFSSGDDWLWEKTAEPLEIKLDTVRTIVVCTPEYGCRLVTIIGD